MALSLFDTWRKLASRLAPLSESALLDAQVLVAHILGKPRAWLLAHPEVQLAQELQAAYDTAAARLLNGEPLPYVLGHWEFFGLDFDVGPAVLIPRPETELLVERALQWLGEHKADILRCADIGTGSGCIAASLAVNYSQVQVTAVDLSWEALQIARRNARRHRVSDRIHLLQADLLGSISPTRSLNLICANLPYIPSAMLAELAVIRHEPRLALDGGITGLAAISRLLLQVPGRLAAGGLLLLEIEASQGDAVLALARSSFPGAEINLQPDLAGKDRLVCVQT